MALDALHNAFGSMDDAELATYLIGGMTKRELLERVEEPSSVVVQALDLDDRDARSEPRVRRAAEHLDVVAEGHQLTGQVVGVDTLAPGVRVAAVRQKGDTQRLGHGPGAWPRPSRESNAASST